MMSEKAVSAMILCCMLSAVGRSGFVARCTVIEGMDLVSLSALQESWPACLNGERTAECLNGAVPSAGKGGAAGNLKQHVQDCPQRRCVALV